MEKQYIESELREKYRKLTLKLIEKGITITTMESCTSGQVASLITDTEGASAVMPGAFVTYSNRAKVMAGVPEEVIGKFSVYSTETAEAMAVACSAAYNTDIGVGITGSFGNADPANPGASLPGQIFFAISAFGVTRSFQRNIPDQPSRLAYKLAAAEEVFEELITIVLTL